MKTSKTLPAFFLDQDQAILNYKKTFINKAIEDSKVFEFHRLHFQELPICNHVVTLHGYNNQLLHIIEIMKLCIVKSYSALK